MSDLSNDERAVLFSMAIVSGAITKFPDDVDRDAVAALLHDEVRFATALHGLQEKGLISRDESKVVRS